MIKLGENSPHWNKHPFIFQKKANLVLLSNIAIRKIAHINSGLALILSLKTSLEQLKKYKNWLAQAFKACRVEQKEKYAKYLVKEMPRRIMTLDELKDMTIKMAK